MLKGALELRFPLFLGTTSAAFALGQNPLNERTFEKAPSSREKVSG